MTRLLTPHSPGLGATYADLENQALSQQAGSSSTPGSLLVRSNAGGFRYYALQQYGPDGRKRETYLAGPVGEPAAESEAEAARLRIREHRDVIASARLLIREGYCALSPKHHAAVAALGNHGFFAGGGMLVGTHAFEVIVNKLGVRTSAFGTTDVDFARSGKLAMKDVPDGGMLQILRSSGITFDEVPNFDPRHPAVKFKERGHSRFTVDLLVPAKGAEISTAAVPELKAHATALPHLRYLIAESQPAAAISRNGCVAVRVPLPERFAIHKLLVARMRRGGDEKSRKDVRQAAILLAALADLYPGAIPEAFAKAPASTKGRIRQSLLEALPLLIDHPAAREAAQVLIGSRRAKPR